MILFGPARWQKYLITKTSGYQPILCEEERFVFDTLEKYLGKADIAYDIGANEGIISCFMAKRCPDGKVFCFEPVPDNMTVLKSNFELNKCTPQLVFVSCAVSNKDGKATFYSGPNRCEGHLEESEFGSRNSECTVVDTVTLDTFVYDLGNEPPNLIKIDVEGAGGLVLEGAQRLLSELRPTIILEFHDITESLRAGKIISDNGYIAYTNKGQIWDYKSFSHFIVCWDNKS